MQEVRRRHVRTLRESTLPIVDLHIAYCGPAHCLLWTCKALGHCMDTCCMPAWHNLTCTAHHQGLRMHQTLLAWSLRACCLCPAILNPCYHHSKHDRHSPATSHTIVHNNRPMCVCVCVMLTLALCESPLLTLCQPLARALARSARAFADYSPLSLQA